MDLAGLSSTWPDVRRYRRLSEIVASPTPSARSDTRIRCTSSLVSPARSVWTNPVGPRARSSVAWPTSSWTLSTGGSPGGSRTDTVSRNVWSSPTSKCSREANPTKSGEDTASLK